MTAVDDLREHLKAHLFGVNELLISSYIDTSHNLGNFLNKARFEELFFKTNENYIKLKDDLLQKIININDIKKLLFFHGFPGVGKSIFIRYFMDYSEKSGHFNDLLDFSGYNDNEFFKVPFATKIFNFNKNKFRTYDFFRKIVDDFDWQKEFDIKTVSLARKLLKTDDYLGALRDNLMLLSLRDLIIIYLFIITKSINDNFLGIVIFDNIDKIEMVDISEKLIQEIFNAISVSERLCQKGIECNFDKLRFVFSLREANHVLLNQHLLGVIGAAIETLDFRFSVGENLTKLIIEKRLIRFQEIFTIVDKKNVMGENAGEDDSIDQTTIIGFNQNTIELLNTIQLFLNDEPFLNILGKLFNYDIRLLIHALHSTACNRDLNLPKGSDYGMRGSLIHYTCKF